MTTINKYGEIDPNNFEEAIIQNATQAVQNDFELLMDAVSNLTKTRLF